MKKLLAITLMMILAISLGACGAKEAVQDAVRDALPSSSTPPNSAAPPSSSNTQAQTPPSSASESTSPSSAEESANVDTSTLAGYLSQFGFTEDDISLANLTENVFHADSKMIEIHTSSTPANAELQECVERIYEKSRSTSENGKVYIYGSDNEFVLSDIVDWNFDWQSSPLTVYWGYKYQGKDVMVAINWFASDMTSFAIIFEEN